MARKAHYIVVYKKPLKFRDIVFQMDVTNLEKNDRHFQWGKIDFQINKEQYVSSLLEADPGRRIFNDLNLIIE